MKSSVCLSIILSFLLGVFLATGCSNSKVTLSENETEPEFGLYLVERTSVERGGALPLKSHEKLVFYEESRYFELAGDLGLFVVLNRNQFVLFEKRQEPLAIKQEDGRINLNISFETSSAKKLEEFTRQYLGQQVAIVIGGELITIHKIRSIITGGGMQISRCTDDGCQLILHKFPKFR